MAARDEFSCHFHAQWDANDQPIGPACGAPPTHIIVWPEHLTWSFACDEHSTPDTFAPQAPARHVYRMVEE